jgi:hypothetical protein
MIHKDKRDRAFIFKTIKRVDSSPNKTLLLKRLGVPRGTYYVWRRLLKIRGKKGLLGLGDLVWKLKEEKIIRRFFKKKALLAVKDLKPLLRSRSIRAIEAKVKAMGFSFRTHNRLFAEQRVRKLCSRCKRLLPVEGFYKAHFESLDGLHVYCKGCVSASQEGYRKRNREKILERERRRRVRLRAIDPHYSAKANTSWRQTAKGAYSTIRNRALTKNRRGSTGFKIEYKDFLNWYTNEPKSCRYCSISLKAFLLIRSSLFGLAKKTSVLTIDRLDSDRPYTRGNLGFACYLCNQCKGYVFSDKEFKKIARAYIQPRFRSLLKKVK